MSHIYTEKEAIPIPENAYIDLTDARVFIFVPMGANGAGQSVCVSSMCIRLRVRFCCACMHVSVLPYITLGDLRRVPESVPGCTWAWISATVPACTWIVFVCTHP